MAKSIPQQLAEHIDKVCGPHNTGGVAQFFNENGTLKVRKAGESLLAFTIACSLVQYESDEHDDYLMNVWNMIQADIDTLNDIQKAVDGFTMPGVK